MSNFERMSAVDVTWLRMDRPSNLMQIVGVIELDPPVHLERLEHALATRLLRIGRFRQRVEERSGVLFWSEDPALDITRHLKRVRLPTPAGKKELQSFVSDRAMTPLDHNYPLWQFHIVEHDSGAATVVACIHHAIADGMALVTVLLSLTDNGEMGPVDHDRSYEAKGMGWLETLVWPLSEGLDLSRSIWRKTISMAGTPVQALRSGTDIAAELAYLALMPSDSQTRFKGHPSGRKRVAWTDPIALPEVQAVSKALGCSINDMLLASVAGALHGYLADKGDETKGIEVRALVPINLRRNGADQQLGNCFGIIAVELPVGLDNPLARLYEVHRRMEGLKSSYEPLVTFGLLETLGYTPKIMQDEVFSLLLSRATAVMTNLPGPQEALYLAGSRISQILYWVPQAGEIGMGVSILSYNGQVQFGLMTDAALVPDPEVVVARFEPEFEQLLYFVLLEPWGEKRAEEQARSKAGVKRVKPRHAPTARRIEPALKRQAR